MADAALGEHEVVVHLYDLSMGMARQFSQQFLGKQIDGIWYECKIQFFAKISDLTVKIIIEI